MPYFDAPPPWMLGAVVAVAIGIIVLGSQLYTALTTQRPAATGHRPPATGHRSPASGRRSKRSPALNYRSSRSPRSKAVQQVQQVQPVQQTPATDSLTLTPLELQQLARAIASVAAGATEQVALELAFSCSKGGGKDWKRAKLLLDAATRPTKA